ncbi:MAG: stress response protein, partial [Bdellovibrionales bacterium]
REFFIPKVNVFSYVQVESKYGSGQFLKDLQKEFPDEGGITLSQIESKDKILDSIKDFLGKGK